MKINLYICLQKVILIVFEHTEIPSINEPKRHSSRHTCGLDWNVPIAVTCNLAYTLKFIARKFWGTFVGIDSL
jgi:hypothetical protein